ncbi:hypothetical protein SCLARK_00866 [Spiroplasma clarkii]|uniref:Uncharacterized protein n=1 Tax=Spiroplasma clarkii TaxID=2139 RepID=A0A1Y0L1B6_9MOLU|nr:hypothetical protein [Spiroplasma clarkii]ARU91479.1 hypothetical protein SCLARK_00866 [Spiroplasma clarkii]ATX70899.1 hypothetical protein SCLAR_v1c05800 [Spiroplasma clarkii]
MEKFETVALKRLKTILTENKNSQINVNRKQDLSYTYENQPATLHNVYLVSFYNKSNIKTNLYIRFNASEALFFIPNDGKKSEALYSSRVDTEDQIRQYLAATELDHYEALLKAGFKEVSPKPHSKFIRFLATLRPDEINMTVEILKHANLAEQIANEYTCDYYDSFYNFINNLIAKIA